IHSTISPMDPGSSATTIHQAVEVRFDYPVVFTRGAFDPANAAFAEALARKEPARRHRFFAVLDAGVAAAWPRLAADIAAYAAHHAARLELAAPVEVIAGGERAKDGDAVARALWA